MLQKGIIGRIKNKKMKKQDNGTTKIYLVTNCNNDPLSVYIGKTKNKGNIRRSSHKRTYGLQIEFTVIDEIKSTDKNDWKPLETYWIQQFRVWGFKVLNQNNGGGGPLIYNEESKIKMRKPRINFPKGENHGSFGKGKSQEHINNMCTDERAKNISKARTGKHYPKASISARNKKMPPLSEEQKLIFGKRFEKKILQFDKQGNFIKEWDSLKQAGLFLGKNPSAISQVCNGKQKTAYGYIWKYKN